MSVLVLSALDVDKVVSELTPNDLVSLMAQVFNRLSSTDISSTHDICLPHRLTVPTRNHAALFMPSRMTPFGTAMKIVSVPTASAPQNIRDRGLPGSTLVLDDETGELKAVVNARNLTALRNAAGSLLSANLVLSPTSPPSTLVAIGAGAQISAHISLFLNHYSSITTCKILNRSMNARVTSLVGSLKNKYPHVNIEALALPSTNVDSSTTEDSFRSAIQQANIIITATSSTIPLFPSAYVSPGTHLCLIGSYTPAMHEIDTELVKRGGKIIVDSRAACKTEAGELILANISDEDMMEIGELVDLVHSKVTEGNVKPGWIPVKSLVDEVRTSGDVTIFKSVGVGVQDVAIACAVVDAAQKYKLGTHIDL